MYDIIYSFEKEVFIIIKNLNNNEILAINDASAILLHLNVVLYLNVLFYFNVLSMF